MIILIDMDDTIERLLEHWVDLVNEKYERNVTCEDVVEWDVSKAFPGLTHREAYEVLLDDEIWKGVEPIPGAAEAMKRFQERGHRVLLVTASPFESIRGKMEYLLQSHFPFLTWDDVIVTRHKQLIRGDVLIDDGFHNLLDGEYRKILVDAPYNRQFDAEAHGMIRVSSWEEIERVVEEIEQEFCEEETNEL